jgi:hypothetical protein
MGTDGYDLYATEVYDKMDRMRRRSTIPWKIIIPKACVQILYYAETENKAGMKHR